MKVKKYPGVDLRNWSVIFFQVGIVVMLLVTWQLLELKSYDKAEISESEWIDAEELEEIIPITDPIDPPPPPPPTQTAATVIIQVEDEANIEETVIESTETSENEEIAEIAEIEEVEIEEEIINVPFAVIENVPIYPGCENLSNNQERRNCLSLKVQGFVQQKFNSDLAGDLGLEGRQRIFVQFRIDHNGKVVEVKARAPHPRLEVEAVRVVSSLPDMIPGKQRGKPVGVQYALPIIFEVRTEK